VPRRCWICGRSRANEAFGGTGRKQGICRDCWPKRPRDREELNLLRDLRRLESKGYVRSDAPAVVCRILASHHEGLRREAAWLIGQHLPRAGYEFTVGFPTWLAARSAERALARACGVVTMLRGGRMAVLWPQVEITAPLRR